MSQDTSDSQNTAVLQKQLDGLLGEAKKINQEIQSTNEGLKANLDVLDKKIGESVSGLEKLYTEMDEIEADAGKDLDKLILQRAEDLGSE